MKFKSLMVFSITALTCLSISAHVVQDSAGNTKLSELQLGVDTVALANVPLRLDNKVAEAADLLRDARSDNDSSYRNMRTYINTGRDPKNRSANYDKFKATLDSVNYAQNKAKVSLEITETGERISAKDYLQAVVKSLD